MSTYTSEPGTKLAGRYRLVDQIWSGSGWIMWKAIDETLARPVTVLTFATGFPRVPEVVTAARAASRLTDPRLAQVFDVEDSEGAYAVMEWLAGQTLTDLLAEGPLDAGRAIALIADAAQALASAHAAGQAHLRLGPGSLRWTRSGGVKISGLGIESALAGPALADPGADPALADTHGLARLLYAALTGYWPSDEPGPLPPAPMNDHGVCTPRQVSADVPAAVDDVVCRALFQRGSRHGTPLTTPRALAEALAAVAPPLPLPEPAPLAPGGRLATGGFPAPEDTSGWVLPETRHRSGTAPYRARYPVIERSPATRAVISVVIVLVLVAVGATAWVLSNSLRGGQPQAGRHTTSPTKPSSAASVLLAPTGIKTFDVYGSGNEDNAQVNLALSGNPQNAWHTSFYLNYPKFGNLKPGEGLILDMGKQVSLNSVTVQFGSTCCASFRVEVGNSNAPSKSTLGAFTVLGSSTHGVNSTSVSLNGNATGRYVLIWLTSLPPLQGQSGKFEAFVSNITLHGAVVHGSG
jgi:hypothetical protein